MRQNADASAWYAKLDEHGHFSKVWTDLPQRKGQRITVTASSTGNKRLEKLIELLWEGDRGGKHLWLWRIEIEADDVAAKHDIGDVDDSEIGEHYDGHPWSDV